MRYLLILLCLFGFGSKVQATSYAFTLENSFAQSAIVAEVEVTSSKVYVSDFMDFEEVEVECKILKLYKGPENLKSFRVRYYSKNKPSVGKALVFAFRPSGGTELRTFNGPSGFVGGKESRFSFSFDRLKAELSNLQKAGSAKPMEGFVEGTLDGAKPLEPGTVTYSKTKD
ncbi:MAG: hypothetical protein ACSHX8_12405 [Opitutaceae bacterium]